MRRSVSSLVIALGLLATPAAAAEPALELLDVPVSYTADFTVSSDKGSYTGTVWHAHGRERRDFGTKGGGQSVLLRRDTDSAYLMKPASRWYVGLGLQAVGALVGGIDSMQVDRRRLREEAVGNIRATRYKVAASGAKGGRFDGDAWFSAKDDILVRAIGELTEPNGKTSQVEMTLSDLKVGKVDERMFEVPSGWLGMDLRSMPPERIAQAVEGLKPMLEGRAR